MPYLNGLADRPDEKNENYTIKLKRLKTILNALNDFKRLKRFSNALQFHDHLRSLPTSHLNPDRIHAGR